MYQLLKEYIQKISLSSTYSYNRDVLPDTPNEVIDIHEYTGSSPLPQVEEVCRNFQIFVRNSSAENASADAISIYKAMRNSTGTISLTDGIHGIIVPDTPSKLSTDTQGRATYSFSLCIISTL